MPYYKEYFSNNADIMRRRNINGVWSEGPLVRDDAVLVGFRGHPSRDAHIAFEQSDISVDPYAYFLGQVSKNSYQARLAERGMTAEGEADRGHAFSLSKYTLDGSFFSSTLMSRSSSGLNWTPVLYEKSIPVPSVAGDLLLRARPNSWNPGADLPTFAQRAYTRSAPTSVVFDAAQFLGELREGLPRLALESFKNSAKVLRGVGSDYLNVEFGWKPLINDIINAGKALAGATELLTGGGQRVHRRYGIPAFRDFEEFHDLPANKMRYDYPGLRETNFGLPMGVVGVATGPSGALAYVLRTRERSQWFEGEFTNFFKIGFDPKNFLDRLDQLVNTKLTPSVLWELAPWSWLIDWSLRIGDTIKANELASSDRLVMHYGYAMEKTIYRDLLSVDMTGVPRTRAQALDGDYWPDLPASASFISTTTYKRRIRANPYGFRTGGTSALSVGQLGILGALGLTKLK